MNQWIPLHAHSDASLMDGLSKPESLVKRSIELGFPGCAITDHGSLGGTIEFLDSAKNACKFCGNPRDAHGDTGVCLVKGAVCKGYEKTDFKPILGCELYICEGDPKDKSVENGALTHLCLLAKNKRGWKKLIKTVSASNEPANFYKKPRLNLESVASIFGREDLVLFSGHPGSALGNCIFKDHKAAYSARTLDDVRMLVRPDWKKVAMDLAGRFVDLFGKENFYLESQLIDAVNFPAATAIVKCLRVVGKEMGIKMLATPDAHYPSRDDAVDQRVLLCSRLDTTLSKAKDSVNNNEEFGMSGFFRSNRYHVPSLEEIRALHEPDEIASAMEIFEKCERYELGAPPMLPEFETPNGESGDHYLKRLCLEGMRERFGTRNDPVYNARLGMELEVIRGANLSGYFSIVHDYCKFAIDSGMLIGRGRGSAAGCAVSYLCRITDVDPVDKGLLFERFYNAGRNSPGKVSLPDCDTDFPKGRRNEVFEYIKNKYGHERVAHICTYGRMVGKGCIKDVLRSHGKTSFEEMNEITRWIPDPAKISGELQEMQEEFGTSSIIQWALENNSKKLQQWASIDGDGNVSGPLATMFEQAIRLENTKRSIGVHPSGLIISNQILADICPMIQDKNGGIITGFDMRAVEFLGLVKFDILGLSLLDKIQGVCDLLQFGEMRKVE